MARGDITGGIEEFQLTEFKKQLGLFIKNKTKVEVNYQESIDDARTVFESKISKYAIIDDTEDYILNVTFRNKREVSVILPKNRLQTNRVLVKGKLFAFEARTDEGLTLLGIGFEVL